MAPKIPAPIVWFCCVTVPLVAGCAAAYAPNEDAWSAHALRMGCLDLLVEPALEEQPYTLRYRFGNRCRGATTVNLKAIRVSGTTGSGQRVPMSLYDPRREVVAKTLPGLTQGEEFLSYESPQGSGDIEELCAELGRVTASAPDERVCVPVLVAPSSRGWFVATTPTTGRTF